MSISVIQNQEAGRGARSSALMDVLFILGILFAPMTALRIFKFGPGEILLILWMIGTVLTLSNSSGGCMTIKISFIGRYQIANLVMMGVGLLVSAVVYHEVESLREIATAFLTHFFMFLLVSCMMSYFETREKEEINAILRKIVVGGAFVYGLLLFYATFVSTSLFGFRLWMGTRTRFLGFALNPHQIGMITGAGLFFSLYLMSIERKTSKKIAYIVVAAIWFWVSLSTKSETMILCYILCAAYFAILKVTKMSRDYRTRVRNYLILLLIVGIVVTVFFSRLKSAFEGFVSESANGEGRLSLWGGGLGELMERPIGIFTGLGPGSHTGEYMPISGHEIEAHNTYVQLILNSGIFICVYYVLMALRVIRKPLQKNTYLVMSVLYFMLYGFGGNMNRRVLVWFTYAMCMVLFEKIGDGEENQA